VLEVVRADVEVWQRGPSWWYSSSVFFSPTLKPWVCSGASSSSC
jgi:hypothetical protein